MKKEMRGVFVGCARDCESHLEETFQWVEQVGAILSDYRVVITENDSTDRTKALLHQYSERDDRITIIHLDGLQDCYPLRTDRIAAARNAYLDKIDELGYNHFDLLIVLDFDGLVGPGPDLQDLSSAIDFLRNDDTNAAVFANTGPVYYDIWALRHDEWCPGDCWVDFENTRNLLGPAQALHRCINDRQIPIDAKEDPIPVKSAFGGLGIYRMRAIETARYSGKTDTGRAVCEHVAFNAQVGRHGTLYILPYLMVAAPIEHVITGANKVRGLPLEDRDRRVALLAPAEHVLDHFRSEHPLYDRRLPLLAALTSRQAQGECMLDVGSNIGDTAALVRLAGARLPVIGIEASSFYYRLSQINKAMHPELFSDVDFRWGLVGSSNLGNTLVMSSGTARLENAEPNKSEAPKPFHAPPVIRFKDAASAYRTAIVKVDIDGFDYAVLEHEYDFLLEQKPIIWAEAQTADEHDDLSWKLLLEKLAGDWPYIVAFDNFGFGVTAGSTEKSANAVLDFISYCRRQRQCSNLINGNVRSFYADVVLFPKRFDQIAPAFVGLLPEFVTR